MHLHFKWMTNDEPHFSPPRNAEEHPTCILNNDLILEQTTSLLTNQERNF